MAFGQLGGDVAQGMHRAPLLISVRPQLPDGLPQSWRPVGDDEPGRVKAASDQVTAEGQPVLIALTATKLQPEQDFSALEGDPPGDQHPLRWRVVGVQLQIDRIQEQVDKVVLVQAALAPAAIALAVSSSTARPSTSRYGLIEGVLQHGLDIPHREPAEKRADDQRLQRIVCARCPAKHPRLEPQPGRVPDPRALDLHRARGRLIVLRPLVAVAMRTGVLGALVAPAAEELVNSSSSACWMISRAPSRPISSIGSASWPTPISVVELVAEPLARGYSRPSGRTSCVVVTDKAEATPASFPPDSERDPRALLRVEGVVAALDHGVRREHAVGTPDSDNDEVAWTDLVPLRCRRRDPVETHPHQIACQLWHLTGHRDETLREVQQIARHSTNVSVCGRPPTKCSRSRARPSSLPGQQRRTLAQVPARQLPLSSSPSATSPHHFGDQPQLREDAVASRRRASRRPVGPRVWSPLRSPALSPRRHECVVRQSSGACVDLVRGGFLDGNRSNTSEQRLNGPGNAAEQLVHLVTRGITVPVIAAEIPNTSGGTRWRFVFRM